jgi:hypothetical protein
MNGKFGERSPHDDIVFVESGSLEIVFITVSGNKRSDRRVMMPVNGIIAQSHAASESLLFHFHI